MDDRKLDVMIGLVLATLITLLPVLYIAVAIWAVPAH